MLVQVNTDNHITGRVELVERVQATITNALERFGNQITRVEVQLNDVNSHKSGQNDKRCLLEARLSGLEPIVVSQQANDIDAALDAALDSLVKTLDRTLGRLREPKGRPSFAGDQT